MDAIIEHYSSTDVADALVALSNVKTFLPGINMFSPEYRSGATKLVGKAYTVQMVDPKEELSGPPLEGHYVDSVPENQVLVISTPADSVNAVWGGLLTCRAKHLKVRGVVIDGRCRDLDELRDEKFPVFCKDTSVYGAGGFTKVGAVQKEIKVAGVSIKPDDVIVADINGVVVIPADMLAKVVEKCAIGKEVDTKCLKDLQQGHLLQETFKKHRT